MAALCHDLGHLPFSHAAESHLLPDGWDHERLTMQFIRSDEMKPIWDSLKVNPEDVAKLAVGPEHYKERSFSDWEAILSEIIAGGAFGVDRIDYLLRDSYHIGAAYGRFDHYRLIDTLRILPRNTEVPSRNLVHWSLPSGGRRRTSFCRSTATGKVFHVLSGLLPSCPPNIRYSSDGFSASLAARWAILHMRRRFAHDNR